MTLARCHKGMKKTSLTPASLVLSTPSPIFGEGEGR